jgi:hypothetical protein
LRLVILSEVETLRSEVSTQSKDPYINEPPATVQGILFTPKHLASEHLELRKKRLRVVPYEV